MREFVLFWTVALAACVVFWLAVAYGAAWVLS